MGYHSKFMDQKREHRSATGCDYSCKNSCQKFSLAFQQYSCDLDGMMKKLRVSVNTDDYHKMYDHEKINKEHDALNKAEVGPDEVKSDEDPEPVSAEEAQSTARFFVLNNTLR